MYGLWEGGRHFSVLISCEVGFWFIFDFIFYHAETPVSALFLVQLTIKCLSYAQGYMKSLREY